MATEAARKAAEIALRYQAGIVAETKPDQSPVTQADRECEQMIARMLSDAFPDDGILGEEGASAESRSGRRWIIDPIDGTRDYVRGNPLWANLIALEAEGDVVVGVVNLPMLRKLYNAQRGGGAFCNDLPIHASAKTLVAESVLCVNGYDKVPKSPFYGRLLDWMSRFWAVRGLGGAADAMMVASGQAEIWLEPSASPWDFAPLKIILEEAGARYHNVDGGSSIYAGNAIGCAPGLEAEVRRFLA
ncbi:MAG TPA: inositol monophosphatase family protein [Bryobacteraceae bacterium]|nr:inositol monophosphatase family protein [Bryobacteraceae bacterium]